MGSTTPRSLYDVLDIISSLVENAHLAVCIAGVDIFVDVINAMYTLERNSIGACAYTTSMLGACISAVYSCMIAANVITLPRNIHIATTR